MIKNLREALERTQNQLKLCELLIDSQYKDGCGGGGYLPGIKQAIEQAEQALTQDDWQQIETAPINEEILICKWYCGECIYSAAIYDGVFFDCTSGNDFVYVPYSDAIIQNFDKPTHWKPLEPPKPKD